LWRRNIHFVLFMNNPVRFHILTGRGCPVIAVSLGEAGHTAESRAR
jgi:hypothetical protein